MFSSTDVHVWIYSLQLTDNPHLIINTVTDYKQYNNNTLHAPILCLYQCISHIGEDGLQMPGLI